MKILVITEGFFPAKNWGGPPVSVDNFCSLLKEHECYIITHNHEKYSSEPLTGITDGWNDRGNCKVAYYGDDKYTKPTFEKAINEIKPDWIYMNCLFDACVLPTLFLAKKYRIKVLFAVRGGLCKGAFKKKYKKLPYIWFIRLFRLLDNVVFQSTSDEETEAIHHYLNIEYDRIHFLNNIPSIPSVEYTHSPKQPGKANFIFLSRIHPKKNLLFGIEAFENIAGEAVLDVYGPLEDLPYWDKCQQKAKEIGLTMNYGGLISHDEVAQTFSKYNCFIFPTLSENYGHVIAESLSVGTMVIVSDQTPWLSLDNDESGFVLSLDDKEGFTNAINKVISYDETQFNYHSQKAKETFVNSMKLDELKNQYLEVLTKYK